MEQIKQLSFEVERAELESGKKGGLKVLLKAEKSPAKRWIKVAKGGRGEWKEISDTLARPGGSVVAVIAPNKKGKLVCAHYRLQYPSGDRR